MPQQLHVSAGERESNLVFYTVATIMVISERASERASERERERILGTVLQHSIFQVK